MYIHTPNDTKATQSVLTENIGRLHTTKMGEDRIKRNIRLESHEAIRMCQSAVLNGSAFVERIGKN